MTIPDPKKIWPELEKIGPDEVRKRLSMGLYANRKIPIIEEWLRRVEARQLKHKESEENGIQLNSESTTVDRFIAKCKNHRFVSAILIVGVIIIAVANFTDALSKLATIFSMAKEESPQHQYASPTPGMIEPIFESGYSIDLLPRPEMKNVVLYLKIISHAKAYTPISTDAQLIFDSDAIDSIWKYPVEIDVEPKGVQPEIKSYLAIDTLLPKDRFLDLIDSTAHTRVKVELAYDPDVERTDVTFTSEWFEFNRKTIEEAP